MTVADEQRLWEFVGGGVRPDRERWANGPWNREPEDFMNLGAPGILVRHGEFGHWCGVVHVPAGHEIVGKSADAATLAVDVYGGVKFAGEILGVWAVGFACDGPLDIVPGATSEYGHDVYPFGLSARYRDIEFARAQAVRLWGQLSFGRLL